MTSTPFQSVALDRIIAPWAAAMAEFFTTILQFILAITKNVGNGLRNLDAFCGKTGQRIMAPQPAPSRPLMPKLGLLLPSASALHASLASSCRNSKGKEKRQKEYAIGNWKQE